MIQDLTARADTTIHAPIAKVWDALINPQTIKRYMFGATVVSDWKEGSSIVWKGEWKGRPYEDKGRILEIRKEERLSYSHYSPMSGAPDRPESYHTVTIRLSGQDRDVRVHLAQDNNKNESARDKAQKNWKMMLDGLKKVVES